MAAGPGREQGMTLAPRSAGQLSLSCAGVEATVPARLAFPCLRTSSRHTRHQAASPSRSASHWPGPACFLCWALRSLSPPSAWSSRFRPRPWLWLLCAQDAPPPPALGPGPSGAGGRGSPDPSAAAASPPLPTPARSVHLLLLPSPSPAWSECIFSWADRRPVGVQVPVGVLRTSWVTLGVSELRSVPLG